MSITELPSILEQAEKIDEEIRFRKKQNPLEWHELLTMQEKFKADTSRFKCIFGGNRSGKTECVADCIVYEAEKRPGLKIWISGETYQDSVAIQQSKIHKLVSPKAVHYGRYDEINGYTNRKLLYENNSIITFKSYDQKREAFQSDDIDITWNDEEMPFDIYKEQRMRLLDRDGQMIISMTSLKGVTELVEDIYEDADIIESQYAPLVDEILPRIAEKNGVRFYFLWSTENPHLNKQRTLDETKHMTRQEIKQRIYGIPLNLTGRIYSNFNKLVDKEENFPEEYLVTWTPKDTRNYRVIWRVENLKDTSSLLPDGFTEGIIKSDLPCNYIFGNVRIDLKN